MGLSALQDNNSSALDLNSLPTENAAEWDKLAKVDDVLTEMGRHYDAIGNKLQKLSEVRAHHGQSLIDISGAITHGN
jgi:hypothetical protein